MSEVEIVVGTGDSARDPLLFANKHPCCENGGMGFCYRCGTRLDPKGPQVRRLVPTGGWNRTGYLKAKSRTRQEFYGRRLVCIRCARTIDLERMWGERVAWLQVLIALVTMLAVFIVLH